MREKARALGFDACRVTSAEAPTEARDRLDAWLAEGAHGDMIWMAETVERRADPRKLMADAKSIVMLGLNYGPATDPLAALARMRWRLGGRDPAGVETERARFFA